MKQWLRSWPASGARATTPVACTHHSLALEHAQLGCIGLAWCLQNAQLFLHRGVAGVTLQRPGVSMACARVRTGSGPAAWAANINVSPRAHWEPSLFDCHTQQQETNLLAHGCCCCCVAFGCLFFLCSSWPIRLIGALERWGWLKSILVDRVLGRRLGNPVRTNSRHRCCRHRLAVGVSIHPGAQKVLLWTTQQ